MPGPLRVGPDPGRGHPQRVRGERASGRVAITAPDGCAARLAGRGVRPDVPAQRQQAAAGSGHAARRPRSGLGELLALVCASHSGEPIHLDGVRRILGRSGLDESALQNPPRLAAGRRSPGGGDPRRRRAHPAGHELLGQARGHAHDHRASTPATSRPIGTRTIRPSSPSSGRSTTSPMNRPASSRSTVAARRCTPSRSTAWPGLRAARAGRPTVRRRQVAEAIRAHPEYVSGTRRDELALHRAIPGLIGKAGAESVYAVGLPDGRGVAIKISDGTPRARAVAMAGVLRRLGFDHDTLRDRPARRCSVTASGSARSARLRRPCPPGRLRPSIR